MRWPAPVLHTNLRHFQTQFHEHSLNYKCKRTFSYYRAPHQYASFRELILFLKRSLTRCNFCKGQGIIFVQNLIPEFSPTISKSQVTIHNSQFFRNFADQSYLKFAVIFLLHVSQCTYSLA
jgi:hypothetical protein